MSRRAFLLAGVSLTLAACQTPATYTHNRGAPAAASGPDQIRLIYVSADDCPWCNRWARDVGAPFERSAERQRIEFSHVHFSSFRSYRVRAAWPEAQRGIYDQLMLANASFTSPLFILMRGDQVVQSGGGTRSWDQTIIPTLQTMLAA